MGYPYLGDLLTGLINQLLSGMILQVPGSIQWLKTSLSRFPLPNPRGWSMMFTLRITGWKLADIRINPHQSPPSLQHFRNITAHEVLKAMHDSTKGFCLTTWHQWKNMWGSTNNELSCSWNTEVSREIPRKNAATTGLAVIKVDKPTKWQVWAWRYTTSQPETTREYIFSGTQTWPWKIHPF